MPLKTTTLRWKLAVEYLALYWGNCQEALDVYERGRTLPSVPTVYCLVNDKDQIVYVGQTGCLRRRIAQHVSDPKKERLRWSTVQCFSPQIVNLHSRLQIEAVLIALSVPRGNQVIALRRKADSQWSEVEWVVRKLVKRRGKNEIDNDTANVSRKDAVARAVEFWKTRNS